MVKKYLTETGKGSTGSVFVWGTGKKGRTIYAKRVGKTVGGLQLWEIKSSKGKVMVYLKSRRELKSVIKKLIKAKRI